MQKQKFYLRLIRKRIKTQKKFSCHALNYIVALLICNLIYNKQMHKIIINKLAYSKTNYYYIEFYLNKVKVSLFLNLSYRNLISNALYLFIFIHQQVYKFHILTHSMVLTTTKINAPVKVVREVLMNFQQYPKWNPFIIKIQGNPQEKQQIHVDIHLPGDKDINHFDPIVLKNTDNEFRWIGTLCCNCFFWGEHYFLYKELSENQTQFTHGQEFGGCLSPLFNCLMQSKTLKGFEMMNAQLKRICEQKYHITNKH